MAGKLTNFDRERIVSAALRHRFSAELGKLVAARSKLAHEVYADALGKKNLALIETLPDGWLAKDSSMGVKFGAQFVNIEFDGGLYGDLRKYSPAKDVRLPVPEKFRHTCVKIYEATHKLAIEYERLRSIETDLKAAYATAAGAARAAVASASTINKLIEIWPEVAPFCKGLAPRALNIPSIAVKQLNALLGLPVAENAKAKAEPA